MGLHLEQALTTRHHEKLIDLPSGAIPQHEEASHRKGMYSASKLFRREKSDFCGAPQLDKVSLEQDGDCSRLTLRCTRV